MAAQQILYVVSNVNPKGKFNLVLKNEDPRALTGRDIKTKIKQITGIPEEAQILKFKGRVVEDWETGYQLGLQTGETLVLEGVAPGPQPFVNVPVVKPVKPQPRPPPPPPPPPSQHVPPRPGYDQSALPVLTPVPVPVPVPQPVPVPASPRMPWAALDNQGSPRAPPPPPEPVRPLMHPVVDQPMALVPHCGSPPRAPPQQCGPMMSPPGPCNPCNAPPMSPPGSGPIPIGSPQGTMMGPMSPVMVPGTITVMQNGQPVQINMQSTASPMMNAMRTSPMGRAGSPMRAMQPMMSPNGSMPMQSPNGSMPMQQQQVVVMSPQRPDMQGQMVDGSGMMNGSGMMSPPSGPMSPMSPPNMMSPNPMSPMMSNDGSMQMMPSDGSMPMTPTSPQMQMQQSQMSLPMTPPQRSQTTATVVGPSPGAKVVTQTTHSVRQTVTDGSPGDFSKEIQDGTLDYHTIKLQKDHHKKLKYDHENLRQQRDLEFLRTHKELEEMRLKSEIDVAKLEREIKDKEDHISRLTKKQSRASSNIDKLKRERDMERAAEAQAALELDEKLALLDDASEKARTTELDTIRRRLREQTDFQNMLAAEKMRIDSERREKRAMSQNAEMELHRRVSELKQRERALESEWAEIEDRRKNLDKPLDSFGFDRKPPKVTQRVDEEVRFLRYEKAQDGGYSGAPSAESYSSRRRHSHHGHSAGGSSKGSSRRGWSPQVRSPDSYHARKRMQSVSPGRRGPVDDMGWQGQGQSPRHGGHGSGMWGDDEVLGGLM